MEQYKRAGLALLTIGYLIGALFANVKLASAGGGGSSCGAGCICSNQNNYTTCHGYESCSPINNNTGSTGTAYYNGGCGAGRGTSSHDYTCFDGPCTANGGGGGGCPCGNTRNVDCKLPKNCKPSQQGNNCGYINGQPAVECITTSCNTCCVTTNPSAPTLNTPVSGYQSATTAVTLTWTAPSAWGENCLGNTTKQYLVYADTSTSPTTLVATLNDPVTSYTFTGVQGATYYWKVTATNGQQAGTSPVWNFSIVGNQITGTVYNDANNNCSQAVVWSAGGTMSAGTNTGVIAARGGVTYNL